jgi:hypothetical protein
MAPHHRLRAQLRPPCPKPDLDVGPRPVDPRGAGFAIHDDAFVLVETLTGEPRLDEPGEAACTASLPIT